MSISGTSMCILHPYHLVGGQPYKTDAVSRDVQLPTQGGKGELAALPALSPGLKRNNCD